LELAQVKSRRHAQSPCHTIHLSKDFRQIHEYLDGRRESHALGAGEVAIGAPVRTESVRGEVPIIRTTVAFFPALPNRALVFGQHQGPLALVMQFQLIRRAQGDAIVRSIQRLNDFSPWVRRADGLRQSLTGSRCRATSGQDDASWCEASHRPRTVGRQRGNQIRFRRSPPHGTWPNKLQVTRKASIRVFIIPVGRLRSMASLGHLTALPSTAPGR